MANSSNPGLIPSSLEKFSPWSSRSNTPTTDHVVGNRHHLSLTRPFDCPDLPVRWFFAVDVPKRKPQALRPNPTAPEAKLAAPKKFEPFSENDSKAIEAAYQKGLNKGRAAGERTKGDLEATSQAVPEYVVFANCPFPTNVARATSYETGPSASSLRDQSQSLNASTEKNQKQAGPKALVPVQEDRLFDVDINERELLPAYWLGPVYEVRRGTWFYHEGNSLRPCEENLATQLEEGFLKICPFRQQRQIVSTPDESQEGDDKEAKSVDEPMLANAADAQKPTTSPSLPIYRLFGPYTSTIVTYQCEDWSTAWLQTDSMISRMSSTVYQRLGGGSRMGGTKVVRGYVDSKNKSKNRESVGSNVSLKDEKTHEEAAEQSGLAQNTSPSDKRGSMETLRTLSRFNSVDIDEDTIQQLEEEEIKDYISPSNSDPHRPIEHLFLVTHGIGQKLGLRMESLNFVADVSCLRKTIKQVFAQSPELQKLNMQADQPNSGILVLPVCWRHFLEFPERSLRQNRAERDVSDIKADDDERYPSLEEITLPGAPYVRQMMSDLGLDILLYENNVYRDAISEIVLNESNRVYNLFMKRNSGFKGKIHLIGHSLGSVIYFDILCHQNRNSQGKSAPSKFYFDRRGHRPNTAISKGSLSFDVDHFYCLGSPLSLFQMVKGRTIVARKSLNEVPPRSPPGGDPLGSVAISSPACNQLFNIFHPSDAVAYRLEPLVSANMSSLAAQPLPYRKKTVFAAPEALSRVSQGMTGLWSTLSTGITTGLTARSLGLSGAQGTGVQTKAPIQDHEDSPQPLGDAPTVLNPEIETLATLYSGFKKSQQTLENVNETPSGADKVKALNSTGRIDYVIQE
ncbi:MAG: hypothetical protein M1814_001701 [Vezdaea aestivalis]|nr:MAG: hypothetical protein M1814_001701 [Vezdaea aestivalis]